jgi:hypothetical protein
MRFAFAALLLVAAGAQAQDKFTVPRAEADRILNADRLDRIKKLDAEARDLEAAIKYAEAKRKPLSTGTSGEIAGFALPLSKNDMPKAKAKLKELQADLAKVKSQKNEIPLVDISQIAADKPIPRVFNLVEYTTNDKGERVASPAVFTVEDSNGSLATSLLHKSGSKVVFETERPRYKVGEVAALRATLILDGRARDRHTEILVVKIVAD